MSLHRCWTFLPALLLAAAWSTPVLAQCEADADYGNAATTNSQIITDIPGTVLVVSADLNADVDSLWVEIYNDLGPGVYALGENYSVCQLCVFVRTEAGDAGYLATGGTLTITQVSPDVILDVSNLTAEHVTIDPGTFVSSPHPDGCTTAITSATISAVAASVPSLGEKGLAVVCGALVLATALFLNATRQPRCARRRS